jgi:hypothetical protein
MKNKRDTKRSRSPSKEGSPLPSSVSTPPSGSPSKVSSRCPRLPVFEQGGPSEKVPVMDLSASSDEEDFIPDISPDEEFARRLFDDLNRDVLGPPDDGNIIILSDSDEEEEVHEDDAADTDAASSSAGRSPAPTTSVVDADEDPEGMQDDNSDRLSLSRQDGACREAYFKENFNDPTLLHHNFFGNEEW